MPALPTDAAIKALPQGFCSSFGYTTHDKMAALPNSLLTDHAGLELRHVPAVHAELHHLHRCVPQAPEVQFVRHLLIPVFGLLANLACMAFYLIGPFMGFGTKMEPLLALGSRSSGASTAASTSSAPARRRAGRRWSTNRVAAGSIITICVPEPGFGPDRLGEPRNSMLDLEFAQLSDPGRLRDHNEDYLGH